MLLEKLKKDRKIETTPRKGDIPIGKWVKCENCKEILYKETVHQNASICPNCGYHFRLSSRRRIRQIVDEGTFDEFSLDVPFSNPLDLEDYERKVENLKEKTGTSEAVVCGIAKIGGIKTVIGVMDGNFLMGSMGKIVGERITYAIEQAIKENLPIIIFCVSGGARMQEGIISLMQMAKTSAAIGKMNEAGLLYICVLTDPTYGGVTASFASLGDIILAEPGTRFGFAGPRVIKQTIGQELPENFQTAEFLEQHGFIDKIVPRKEMKQTLEQLLRLHQ